MYLSNCGRSMNQRRNSLVEEAASRSLRHVRVVHRLGDLGELPLGDEVNARAVDRGRDLAGQERAVVAGVVPRETALVEAVLPEGDSELDGFDRLLAVDDDLALVVDLGRAEAPRHRICPAVGIAQTVAKGLTHRKVLLLER